MVWKMARQSLNTLLIKTLPQPAIWTTTKIELDLVELRISLFMVLHRCMVLKNEKCDNKQIVNCYFNHANLCLIGNSLRHIIKKKCQEMPVAFISSIFSGCKVEKSHNNWADFFQVIFCELHNKDHEAAK